MSVAGSIPLIVFLITWFIQKNSFNYSLGKILLYLSMMFYLVPFQLLTRMLPNIMYNNNIVNKIRIFNSLEYHFEYDKSAYINIDDGIMWVPRWIIFILHIWFIIVVFFAIYQIMKYRKSIHYILKDSEERSYDINGAGTVSILINNNITTPYTVGFIRLHIVFPENIIESQYSYLVYRHELCHAKNYDALIKLICLIIICLHWFNPISILLLFSYSTLCEYISDDYATKGLTHEEKREYAKLLLDVVSSKTMPVVWRNNFLSTEYLLKRRLTYIMKKKFSKIQKLITVIVSIVTVLACAVTVFAYEPFVSTTDNAIIELSDGDFVDFGFIESFDSITDEINFHGHEEIFITDDGEYIIIDNDHSSYAICNHTFADGRYSKHISNSTGGCTVKIYDAQICTKCKYVVVGDLISTTTYVTCTHTS
jgi:beta-lactamase regulating signal transducer with metallopeptidase domain